MRRPALLIPLVLAACTEAGPVANVVDPQARAEAKATKREAADARAVSAGFAPAAPEPIEVARIDPRAVSRPGSALPPSSDQYRYIGRWAANPGLCERGAWRFETRRLSTAGETSCSYPEVANVPGGYELTGTCTAEGQKTDQIIKLRFDEAKRTMRVAGRTLGPVDLIYCGA